MIWSLGPLHPAILLLIRYNIIQYASPQPSQQVQVDIIRQVSGIGRLVVLHTTDRKLSLYVDEREINWNVQSVLGGGAAPEQGVSQLFSERRIEQSVAKQ